MGAVDAALDDEVPAHLPRTAVGLAVHERVPRARRWKSSSRSAVVELLGAMRRVVQQHDLDRRIVLARERLLLLRAVDLQHDPHRHAGRDARQRRLDRRDHARVADEQVPVGRRVGRVGAARADELHEVARLGAPAAHGPASPSSPWTTKSSVRRLASGSHARTV